MRILSEIMPYGLKRRTGQIAAVLLLVMAIMFFLGSAGIFYAQKKYFQTKAKIATDAGAMYLNSIVGSYAHYLACKFLKCKCKKKKRRWAAIAALAIMGIGGLFGGLGILSANWALAITTTGLSIFVQDEIATTIAVKRLRSIFKRLASARDMLRWATISYVVPLLADPEVMPQVNEALVSAMSGAASGSGGEDRVKAIADAIKEEILKAYDLSGLFAYAGQPGSGGSKIKNLLEALELWDKLAGTRINKPNFYVEKIEPDEEEGEAGGTLVLSAFDYIKAVLYGGVPGISAETSLAGTIQSLKRDDIYGIEALEVIKDWDPEERSEGGQFYQDFDRIKGFISDAINTIRNSDLQGAEAVIRTRSFGVGQGWREIHRYGRVKVVDARYRPIGGVRGDYYVRGGDYLTMLRKIDYIIGKGADARIFSDDYADLKNGLIEALNDFASSMDEFMNRIDGIIANYKDKLMQEFGEGSYSSQGNAFNYSWVDRLGRRHSLSVSFYFKMPKIKVKKSLTKVKLKLKRCKQTVWLSACRNGYCFRTSARYHAKKHKGPTTNEWWIQGN